MARRAGRRPRCCGVLAPSTTSFADSLANGVEVGFRSGYSLPFGNLSAYEGMGALFDGVVPIWVDAGYRTPHLYVGAFFQYGLVLVSGEAVDLPAAERKRLNAQTNPTWPRLKSGPFC